MKFGKLILIERVPEWAEAYLEYNILKKLLTPAKILQKKFISATYKEGNVVYHITNRKNLKIEQVVACIRTFEEIIKCEIIKIDKFFHYKLLDLMYRYKLMMINASFIGKSLNSKSRMLNEQKLKYSFKIFYKEVNMVKNYIKLNQTGFAKIVKKYSKVVKSLQQTEGEEFNLVKRVQAGKESTYLARNEDKLLSIMKKTEDNYINYFYPDISQQKHGRKDFRLYTTPQPLSSHQVLFYGVFCGISCLLLLFIILKFIEVYSEAPSAISKTRLSRIFPLFRGNGLFITYIWLLAWNVHGWQNNHINYKLIFKFNHHFSQMYQILQRAAFFTFIYFVCFVWYIILNTPHQSKNNTEGIDLYSIVDWIDMDLLPIFGWLTLLCYVFFPFFSITIFNPEGRLYFFNLLLDCLKSPFVKMEFKIGWMTDMLVSFAGPLKDLETTICFYITKAQGDQTDICNSDNRITQILLNIIPTLYRILQCCRQGYDKKVFWRTWPFYNLIKYIFSLITSLISYQYSKSKEQSDLIWWFIIGAISTVYSFYWDISQDWGLLKFGKTWRETQLIGRKLYYGNRNYYLFAIFSNLLLRIVWVLNISLGLTEIIDKAMNIPGMFKFIVYFLELYRRCQWNFFRVELEHINNCSQYRAVVDLELPIQVDMTSDESTYAKYDSNHKQYSSQQKATKLHTHLNNDIELNSQNIAKKEGLLSSLNHNIDTQIDGEQTNYNAKLLISAHDRIETNTFLKNTPLNHKSNSIGIAGENYFISSNADIIPTRGNTNQVNGIIEDEDDESIKINTYQIKIIPCEDNNNNNTNNCNRINNNDDCNKSKNSDDSEVKGIEIINEQIYIQDKQLNNQFKRDLIKIKSSLQQFEEQVKNAKQKENLKKTLKILKEIKPFLRNEQLNQVQIQSKTINYLNDEEQFSLHI